MHSKHITESAIYGLKHQYDCLRSRTDSSGQMYVDFEIYSRYFLAPKFEITH
jgi:hypothetical protein